MTKRKQTEPRRTRPAPTECPSAHDNGAPAKLMSDFSGSLCEEPGQKQFKSDCQSNSISPIENACDDTESPKWQWNISDFRKKHVEFSKELSAISEEALNPLELSNCSRQSLWSSQERLECSKDDLESSKERLGGSKGFSHVAKESSVKLDCSKKGDKASMESPANSIEWTKPSEEMKQSMKNSGSNLKGQALESNADGHFPEKQDAMKFEHDNMPVILDVFSLSKDFVPGKQFVSSTKQENSLLNTPPSTPPLMQLGAFSGMPVNCRHSSFHDEFVQQGVPEQRYGVGNSGFKERECWYKPAQRVQYNSHLSYPMEQINSQGFQSDPVQQGYPQEYTNKLMHLQEYRSQQTQQVYYNQQWYSSNPVHPVNPPPAYNFNPVPQVNYNPKQIANGVLPLEKDSSMQNVDKMQANNTARYKFADPSKQAPRLKSHLSSESYLVKCSAEGSGIYGRFRLQHFDSGVLHEPTAPPFCVQTESNVVHPNRTQARDTKIMFSPPPSNIRKHNCDRMNVTQDYNYGIANGYSFVQIDEFGRTVFSSTNSLRAENFSRTSERISRIHGDHTFRDFENHPLNSQTYTTISENPPVAITEKDPTITEKQCHYSNGGGPWDKKILELKQRVAEHEATLRKLRASH